VSNPTKEAAMDLLDALGVTRQQALLGAGVGLLVAVLIAANAFLRRAHEDERDGLGLHDR
jgi:hypothetical protein